MAERHHSSSTASFEATAEQLTLITQVSAAVARRGRLSPDDVLDFSQHVHLKFLESGYEMLRRFDGRSALKTYLTVVIGRLLLDWRRRESGRWRPSAEATRLGPHAVDLERMISRDGYSAGEAVELVSTRSDAPARSELWTLLTRLPARVIRRRVEAPIEDAAVAPFEDALEAAEQERATRRTWRTVVAAIEQLPASDRRLLDLRYRQGLRMPAIGHTLGEPPKRLYGRCSQILQRLRASVEAARDARPYAAVSGSDDTSTVLPAR